MTLVVKVGGSAGIITGNIVHEIAQCVAEGQRIVVLHGGSDLTNSLSEQLGHPVRMITSPGGMVVATPIGKRCASMQWLWLARSIPSWWRACSSRGSTRLGWRESMGGCCWPGASQSCAH